MVLGLILKKLSVLIGLNQENETGNSLTVGFDYTEKENNIDKFDFSVDKSSMKLKIKK